MSQYADAVLDFGDLPAEFLRLMQPGMALRIHYGEGHLSNERWHIRAIVDGEWVVYRAWQRRRRWWMYRCEHVTLLLDMWEKGYMTQARLEARP